MNKERLATEFCGLHLATPVMGASGTFGFGVEYAVVDRLGAA